MKIPYLPLGEMNKPYHDSFRKALDEVLHSGRFIGGETVTQFENEWAAYCDVNHCVGVANGLDALTLILKAWIQLGELSEGDGIIVPANTYIASILAIKNAELIPVLVDPDPETLVLSVEGIKKVMTPSVKGVMTVDLYGRMVSQEVYEYASSLDLKTICDAAQAHGARSQGKKSGSLADATAFSFYPSKNLGALGDAGAVVTDNEELSSCIRILANYGKTSSFIAEMQGINSRLDPIQAAFLSIKLKDLDTQNAVRQSVVLKYCESLHNPTFNTFPNISENEEVFHVFPLFCSKREKLLQYLQESGIGVNMHYQVPPHQQKALKEYAGLSFPVTEWIHERIVSIPCHPLLQEAEQDYIIDVLNSYE